MKHFAISLVIFFTIIIGSIFSHGYTTKTLTGLKARATSLSKVQSIDVTVQNRAMDIKEMFESEKGKLQFFLNKEHVQDIETSVLLLESAAENDEPQSLRENSIQLMCLLDHADSSLTAFE